MDKEFRLFYDGHRMTPVIQKLQDLKIAITTYNRVDPDPVEPKIIFGYSINAFLKDAIRTLETNLDDIRHNNCRDAIPGNIKELTKLAYWLEDDDHLKQEMYAFAENPLSSYDLDFIPKHKDTIELYNAIVEGIRRMIELLLEIDAAVKAADETELYLSLYRNLRAQYCEDEALDFFDDLMRNSGKLTFGKLKMQQMQVIATFINGGTLNCAPASSDDEREDVAFDKRIMPHEFTYKEYFMHGWAVLNRSIKWKKDIVVPDYSCVGLFFNQRWDKLSEWDLKQVFFLDTILDKIHNKMLDWKPELGKYIHHSSAVSLEDTNYYAPARCVTELFRGEWLEMFRTSETYTFKWCETLIQDLFNSELKDALANEWSYRSKRLGMKGSLIGCLKYAGVIEGSNLSIASAILGGNEKDVNTFAKYIGKGSQKPYQGWIVSYVRLHQ